jgi:chorismate mutase/prephenate dehydratase
MTASGALQGITRVCAHPQALAQCQAWLDRNAPDLERVPVSSNARGRALASIEAQHGGHRGGHRRITL